MALKRVDERLSRLSTLVEKWNNSGNVPRIERDMALEELRHIYDELLDYTPQQAETPVVEAEAPAVEEPEAEADEEIEHSEEREAEEVVEVVAPAVAAAVVTAHEDVGDAFDDALDIDALLGLSGDDSIEEAEAEANTEAEVKPEESAPERPIGGGLFDIDDIPVRTKSGRKMISLYDAPIKTSEPAKESVPEPAEEVVMVEKVEVEPAPAPQPGHICPPPSGGDSPVR